MGEAKRSKLVNNEAVATMGVGILQISGGLFEIEIGLWHHHIREGEKDDADTVARFNRSINVLRVVVPAYSMAVARACEAN